MKKEIEYEAAKITRDLSIQKGQYKIWCKQNQDEWGKSLVDALF